MGVPPLYRLCRELISQGRPVQVALGFGSADEIFLAEEFRALGAQVNVATMDGSAGMRGTALDACDFTRADFFHACGPTAMLKALCAQAGIGRGQPGGTHGLRLWRLHGLHDHDPAGSAKGLQGRAGLFQGGAGMVDLSVTLCGIELTNPLIAASGTFGFGQEYASLYDLNQLGSFSFKGTTLEPREGNPAPRIAECPGGMLNAVGLQNPGVHKVISEELPALARVFGKPVMANVSGFSIAEYVEVCQLLDAQEQVGWLEVNISCPNVHGGGMAFGSDPGAAAAVTRAVRRVCKKPVIIKLSPNVGDIAQIARACEDEGADGLSLINTLLGLRLNLKTQKPLLPFVTGGLSGPAIFPIALRMVWQVYKAVKIPDRHGRHQSAEDVIEMMLCGATAVRVGAPIWSIHACPDVLRDLPAWPTTSTTCAASQEVHTHGKGRSSPGLSGGTKPWPSWTCLRTKSLMSKSAWSCLCRRPGIVRAVGTAGTRSFWTPKLHDIPTPSPAPCAPLRGLGVDMMNLRGRRAGNDACRGEALRHAEQGAQADCSHHRPQLTRRPA